MDLTQLPSATQAGILASVCFRGDGTRVERPAWNENTIPVHSKQHLKIIMGVCTTGTGDFCLPKIRATGRKF